MNIRPEKLGAELKRSLLPIYLIHGGEPLLVAEAADTLRKAVREAGYSERETFDVEQGFDWSGLIQAGNNLSLFAEQRLLDLRMPGSKPGTEGAKVLKAYAERPAPDTILLITCGKLEAAQEKSAWFKALTKEGADIKCWPVDLARLPQWISGRFKERGISASSEACSLLAESCEGNLLAAAQEIDKCAVLFGDSNLDAAALMEVISDSARYSVYDLVDAALEGNTARSLRILRGLSSEGIAPVLVNWAVQREARVMSALAGAQARGALEEEIGRRRVWGNRKGLVKSALSKRDQKVWPTLLEDCAVLDRMIKRGETCQPWDELTRITLRMSGAPASGTRTVK